MNLTLARFYPQGNLSLDIWVEWGRICYYKRTPCIFLTPTKGRCPGYEIQSEDYLQLNCSLLALLKFGPGSYLAEKLIKKVKSLVCVSFPNRCNATLLLLQFPGRLFSGILSEFLLSVLSTAIVDTLDFHACTLWYVCYSFQRICFASLYTFERAIVVELRCLCCFYLWEWSESAGFESQPSFWIFNHWKTELKPICKAQKRLYL